MKDYKTLLEFFNKSESKNKFNHGLGDVVYLKTDNQQLPRIVTEICLQGGTMSNYIILYELAQSDVESKHYDSEISKTKDKNLTLGI
tara:strand:- start:289 stop:549 length:261 start_codon:yes stop_codon:yes gene_type:complete